MDNVSYLSTYPFDRCVFQVGTMFQSDTISPGHFSYYTDIVIFAQDVLMNDSVSVELSTSYGLITYFYFLLLIYLPDRTSSSGMKTTTDAVEYSSWWPKDESVFLRGLQRAIHIYMNLQHSPLVITYCLIITVTFCLSLCHRLSSTYWPHIHTCLGMVS